MLLAAPAAGPTSGRQVDEPAGFWHGDINAPVPKSIHGGKVLHVRGVKQLLASRTAAVVDVSNAPRKPEGLAPDAWMPLPHKALPNAMWIPGAGEGEVDHDFDVFLRKCVAAATQGDLDRPLIVYCHSNCWLSWNAAKRVIGYGYRRVYWFPDGIEGWAAAKLPVAVVKPSSIGGAG